MSIKLYKLKFFMYTDNYFVAMITIIITRAMFLTTVYITDIFQISPVFPLMSFFYSRIQSRISHLVGLSP